MGKQNGKLKSGLGRSMREALVVFVQVIPVFAVAAYFSSIEKALVASTVLWAILVAVSERKEGWQKPGFW
jgi:hypothetical protein